MPLKSDTEKSKACGRKKTAKVDSNSKTDKPSTQNEGAPGEEEQTIPVQFNLKLFDSRPEILKKPVQAVHMAITGGVQNRTQRLAFNAMLKNTHSWHAKNPDKTTEIYEMPRAKLMELIDYTSPNRTHLKKALKQMQSLAVEWDLLKQDGSSKYESCTLLPYVGFDEQTVFYSFSPVIKPMLLESSVWAQLDLRIQRSFRLDASAALYEWCNRYRNTSYTKVMPWEDWRWVIYGAVDEHHSLNEYKTFKRRKLMPAINEINNSPESDLELELIEDKDGGRAIKLLQFKVTEKPLFKAQKVDDSIRQEWEKKLEGIGIKEKDIGKILDTYQIDTIEAHYHYTKKRLDDPKHPKIRNIAKYLIHAIESGYANDMIKDEEKQQQEESSVLLEIQEQLAKKRNDDAASMFSEMFDAEQEKLITEYNEFRLKEDQAYFQIPNEEDKRVPRLMIPFYGWLAKRTWGEISAKDLFSFALASGKIELSEFSKKE